MGLTTYLLVRDADGAILEEFDSAETALRVLDDTEEFRSGVSVVRFDDSPGAVVGITSLVKAQLADFPAAVSRGGGRRASRRPA